MVLFERNHFGKVIIHTFKQHKGLPTQGKSDISVVFYSSINNL